MSHHSHTLIDEIRRRLDKYPAVKYEIQDRSIGVKSQSEEGFTVWLILNSDDTYTVFFEGWHENFDHEEEALEIFAFGLSDECRLKEYRRAGFAYRWTVELWVDGKWCEHSTTGLLLFPFWKKPVVRYLKNNVIRGDHSVS
jgi:hypothetical protein